MYVGGSNGKDIDFTDYDGQEKADKDACNLGMPIGAVLFLGPSAAAGIDRNGR